MARILIAEDDERQVALMRTYLERDGHSVIAVHDGRSALDETRRVHPDLLVLDVMMPKVDGLDVCRVLRYEGIKVPIIMVTARTSEDDMLLGLDLGADDYLTKPYRMRELVARVRAVLRRHSDTTTTDDDHVRIGGLDVDLRRMVVHVDGAAIELTPKEFAVIRALGRQPGRVMSRRQLLDAAFGFDHYALDRTIDMHVMHVRRKIELDPNHPRYVLTVKGYGYRLADEQDHHDSSAPTDIERTDAEAGPS